MGFDRIQGDIISAQMYFLSYKHRINALEMQASISNS